MRLRNGFMVGLLLVLVSCSGQGAAPDLWTNVKAAVSGDYSTEFPPVPEAGAGGLSFDLGTLTEPERLFFEKYVGFYLRPDQFDYARAQRWLYSVSKQTMASGSALHFGRVTKAIDYDPKTRTFALQAQATTAIRDLGTFQLPAGWVRASSPEHPEGIYSAFVERKKADSENARGAFSVDARTKDLAKAATVRFFDALSRGDVEALASVCLSAGVVFDDPSSVPIAAGTPEFKGNVSRLKGDFEQAYIPKLTSRVLLNVFFTEDPAWVQARFPGSALVELVFNDPDNAFGLVLAPEGGVLKVAYIRNSLDEE